MESSYVEEVLGPPSHEVGIVIGSVLKLLVGGDVDFGFINKIGLKVG